MATAAVSPYIDAIRHLPAGSTLIASDVSWDSYEALLAELGDACAVRVTFDEGTLEVVSPSAKHEKFERFIEAVAGVVASELGLDLESFGSATFRRKDVQRGAEPDACFYVQHAAVVVGRDTIDLSVDPPPDVVLEVEVSRSSARKQRVYAALGVLEIWRCDGERVSMYRLDGAEYSEIPSSLAFPPLTADTLTALLVQLRTKPRQAILEAYRQSLRASRGT